MTVLVVGASGATGRLLVNELLSRGQRVRVLVRSLEKLPETVREHNLLSVVHANIHDLSDDEITQLVKGCTAVVSCLGHNLTLKGIYGSPRKLVTEATRRLCEALQPSQAQAPVRFVLMNTAGNSNHGEPVSLSERCVLGLVRLLLPPHIDNEMAADYLRTHYSLSDRTVEWTVVRPDTLVNETNVSDYVIYPSPTRSAIFNAGKTSRINVAHFMANLITDENTWNAWKGQMPVIYNKG